VRGEDGLDRYEENWAAQYCQWNNGSVDWDSKYKVINTTSLNRQTTVEFRQHHGTLDSNAVIAWLEFTRQLVHAASVIDTQVKGPNRMEHMFSTISKPSWTYISQQVEASGQTMTDVINQII
jgi:hypothetical protein